MPAASSERKSSDSAANRDAGALAFQMRLTSFRLTHGTNSPAAAHAAAELVRTKANQAVIEAIGSPISQTGIVSGNSNVSGAVGEANLSIPLSGPKGKATLYVEAKKSADTWFFQTMVVKIEKTGERIDLNTLPVPARAASPPHL